MKLPGKIVLAVLVLVLLPELMLIVALHTPNSLHTNSDFLAIYDADLRLLQHIGPYDYQGQIRHLAAQTATASQGIYVPQFPYPPWYALSTFYLGLLPIQAAALLWFEINLVLLFLAVWFLSASWPPRMRLFSFLAPFLFIPVIGTLGVGQYDFPVLLGCAILIYAIRRERLVLTALGAALLTFKPHLGIPIFLGLLLYLLPVRDRFSRRALAWIFSGLAILCVIGLLADPTWMVDYPRSFQAYQTGADIASCAACDSLPSWLATHSISSPSLFQMTLIGAGLFLVLILLFSSVRAGLLRNVGRLLSVSILIPLLAIPHLYNYDFVLLLVPFAVLAEGSHGWGDRIALMLLYVFPFLAIAIFGRVLGDPSLLLVALALALLVFLQARPRPALDVSRHAA